MTGAEGRLVQLEALIPAGYCERICARDGEQGQAFVHDLPAILEQALKKAQLAPSHALAGGMNAVVIAGTLRDGRRAALKITPPYIDIQGERLFLRLSEGHVSPALYDVDEQTNSFLLELIEPALPVATGERQQDVEAAAALITTISSLTPPDRLATLTDRVSARQTNARRVAGKDQVPAEFAEQIEVAEAIAEQLVSSAPAPVFSHGDFWRTNMLRSDNRGLLAIDAAPCLGDPAADLGFWAMTHRDHGTTLELQPRILERAQQVGDAAGLNGERIARWSLWYLLCSLSTRFNVDDPAVWSSRVAAATELAAELQVDVDLARR